MTSQKVTPLPLAPLPLPLAPLQYEMIDDVTNDKIVFSLSGSSKGPNKSTPSGFAASAPTAKKKPKQKGLVGRPPTTDKGKAKRKATIAKMEKEQEAKDKKGAKAKKEKQAKEAKKFAASAPVSAVKKDDPRVVAIEKLDEANRLKRIENHYLAMDRERYQDYVLELTAKLEYIRHENAILRDEIKEEEVEPKKKKATEPKVTQPKKKVTRKTRMKR